MRGEEEKEENEERKGKEREKNIFREDKAGAEHRLDDTDRGRSKGLAD